MKQNHWTPWLKKEFDEPYFKELAKFVHEEYEHKTIYPPKDQVFSAFEETDLPDIKVVILGQDPYINPNQAHGMAFSVNPGIAIPPSLLNMYKELQTDLNCTIPNNGYLMPWAKQGVFLLNTVLTVEAGISNSHKKQGWEKFTDHAIMEINHTCEHVVFMLWGRNARDKAKMIDQTKHLVLEAPHPSPLSAYNGFFGCHHFSKANAYLIEHGKSPIHWQIPNIIEDDEIEAWVMSRRNRNHGLEPLKHVCKQLNNPQQDLPIIHVAGTNGKGSVVNYLKDILMAKDYRVGTFTSPHLIAHRDRIRINDAWIQEETFKTFIKDNQTLIEQYDLGMFEIDLLVTFIWMKEQQVDYLLLETGIGGRLDQTNLIEKPILEVITSVGFDHMDLLGERIEQIAFEKAGIIKEGSSVVVGNVSKKVEKIIHTKALRKHASYIKQKKYQTIAKNQFLLENDIYTISSNAKYQMANAATALTAAWALGINIHEDDVKEAITNSQWLGRFETIQEDPTIIIDGAHNEEGIDALIQSFDAMERPIVTIFSALKDKPGMRMANRLADESDTLFVTQFSNERKDSEEHLKQLPGVYYHEYLDAIKDGIELVKEKGTLVITGSLYFISIVRNHFTGE